MGDNASRRSGNLATCRRSFATRVNKSHGLRYINRINKETEQDHLSMWFIANDYIPAGFLRSESGFLLREEIHVDAENRLITTLGDLQAGVDEQYGATIFDIDRIVEREVPTGQEVLIQEMDRLH
jgi:uncharacterized protein (TIGR04255 family)